MNRPRTWADVGIELPPNGGRYTKCPACDEGRSKRNQRPLGVDRERGLWYCNHCGWSGSLDKGVQIEPYGSDGSGSIRPAKREYRRPDPPAIAFKDEARAKVMAFFRDRSISQAVVDRAKIVASDAYFPQIEREVGCIAIPYYRGGELINTKYRGPEKIFRMETGAELCFWGLDDCLDAETVIIVEGEFDKMAIESATGNIAVLSVPNGSPFAPAKDGKKRTQNAIDTALAYMADPVAEAIFERAKKVIIAGDADEAGALLVEELARRIGREKCWRVTWPDGAKDANDTLMNVGPWAVDTAIKEATPYPIEGVFSVKDLAPGVRVIWENGLPAGFSTGWPALDKHFTIKTGLSAVFTGIPQSGKSAFVDALTINLAKLHGWRTAMFSPEYPPERHVAGMAQIVLNKTLGPRRGHERMSREELDGALDFMNEHVVFIHPDQPTIGAILDRAKILVRRHGIKMLVIDPWTEVEHSYPNGMPELKYIANSLTELFNFGQVYDVFVALVAHPRKLNKDRETGLIECPTPYDIAGAAHFYNKPDYCIAVHRDVSNTHGDVSVHIQKVRFAETGLNGVVKFQFDRQTGVWLSEALLPGQEEPE